MRRPVWVLDPQAARIVWANAAAVELWGSLTLEALLARDLSAVSPAVRIRTASQMPLFASGETVQEKVTLYPKGQAVTCDLLVSGVQLDAEGDADRVVMLIEATPVEIAPGEVRALEALRHTKVLVTLYDNDGLALFRNPAAIAALPSEPHRFGVGCDQKRKAELLWAEVGCTGHASGVLRTDTASGPRWHGINLHRSVDPATGMAGVLVDERDITSEI